VLIEQQAVTECDHHGHRRDRSDPDAWNRAREEAWRNPFPDSTPEACIGPSTTTGDLARGGIVAGCCNPPTERRPIPLVGPNTLSALLAFKHMNNNSAFVFHDRFEEREPSGAEAAVMA
jgi:hypothetical protein